MEQRRSIGSVVPVGHDKCRINRELKNMGSLITLSIGNLEVDWSKNDLGNNHSALFQDGDLSEAPYYYASDNGEIFKEPGPAYVKKLSNVKGRLELLGYDLPTCQRLLRDAIEDAAEPELLYDLFLYVIQRVDVNRFRTPNKKGWALLRGDGSPTSSRASVVTHRTVAPSGEA